MSIVSFAMFQSTSAPSTACSLSGPKAGLAAVMLLLVLALANPLPAQEGRTADQERAENSAPYQVATQELARLAQREGSEARSEVLVRNLSRYFTVYLVPPEQEELRRLLGTAQRMTQQAARLFYRASQAAATQQGATEVGVAHVERVLAALLPSTAAPYSEEMFFPGTAPTPLERWDLQALQDTGLAWEALGYLADAEIAKNPDYLPMDSAAARRLAQGVNAYGLLVFRLGGEHAKSQLDTHVRTTHLREAGKTISARAKGEAAPIGEPRTPATKGSLFTDMTDAMGVSFRHESSDWLGRFRRYGPIAPTFSGGGAAAGDVNSDGWEDLVVCGGRGCETWLNQEGSKFDRAADNGSKIDGEARMPILADFDNDGDADLFITYARDTNRLLENDGSGTFRDVTTDSGLFVEGDVSGPASAVDVNGDGFLDLYVGNFGNYLSGDSAWVAQDSKNGMPNRLYLNKGGSGLQFEEAQTGAEDQGWAQALSHLDYDLDGDQDLYIANDFGRNQLLANDGTGRFTAVGSATGSDDPHHGMNVAFADLNQDDRPDIFVTNIWFWASATRKVTETNTLLMSRADEAIEGGVAYDESEDPSLLENDSSWAWAGLFFDVENDGDDDLFIANGFTDYMTFVQYRKHPETPDQLYAINNGRTPNLFFRGNGGVPDELVEDSGTELDGINSRSAVLFDMDRDGDLDLAVTTFHDRLRILRNDAEQPQRALTIQLKGDPEKGSSLDAIGARVTAVAADLRVWRAVQGGEGYLGMNSLAIEIGTGAARAVDVEIVWPGGERQKLEQVPTGQAVRVRQGNPEAETLWTFSKSADPKP